jgi:hypothetical protein
MAMLQLRSTADWSELWWFLVYSESHYHLDMSLLASTGSISIYIFLIRCLTWNVLETCGVD